MLKTSALGCFIFPLPLLQVWPSSDSVTVEAATYPKMLNTEVNKSFVNWSCVMAHSCLWAVAIILHRTTVCTNGICGRINILTYRNPYNSWFFPFSQKTHFHLQIFPISSSENSTDIKAWQQQPFRSSHPTLPMETVDSCNPELNYRTMLGLFLFQIRGVSSFGTIRQKFLFLIPWPLNSYFSSGLEIHFKNNIDFTRTSVCTN